MNVRMSERAKIILSHREDSRKMIDALNAARDPNSSEKIWFQVSPQTKNLITELRKNNKGE